jgi:Fe2+ or Zn2+ uptake regulation protein
MRILSEVQKPLSVSDIQELLAEKNQKPNKTTLYRMLERLEESGKVNTLLLDPKVTYYELKNTSPPSFSLSEL